MLCACRAVPFHSRWPQDFLVYTGVCVADFGSFTLAMVLLVVSLYYLIIYKLQEEVRSLRATHGSPSPLPTGPLQLYALKARGKACRACRHMPKHPCGGSAAPRSQIFGNALKAFRAEKSVLGPSRRCTS